MADESELMALWETDLKGLAAQLKLRRSPTILWLPASLSHKPGAWGGLNHIVLTRALMDQNQKTRVYLLAHELGHIVMKHSKRACLPLVIPLTYLIPYVTAQFFGFRPSATVKLSSLIVLLCAVSFLAWRAATYDSLEYEADRVAVSLLGKQAIIDGICDMAIVEGAMTRKRKARLNALESSTF